MSQSWRDRMRPIIEIVLKETQGQPDKDVRAALRAAFTKHWGPRTGWPYKVWCSEWRFQVTGKGKPKRVTPCHPDQGRLFDG